MYELTQQDVRALRNADAICFDLTRGGEYQIRAIKRAEDSSTGFEQTHLIPCEGRLHDYTKDFTLADHQQYVAFSMFQSARYHERAQTLVRRFKVGDAIVLNWVRGNSSPVSEEIGYVKDQLSLRVGKPAAKVADEYLIDVYTGYDNTARMVRVI